MTVPITSLERGDRFGRLRSSASCVAAALLVSCSSSSFRISRYSLADSFGPQLMED